MPHKSTVQVVATIGIDMGKNTLHMVGLDLRGAIVLRERVSHGGIASSPCLIASKQEWRHTMLLASLPRLATM